jgi:membrane protein implicated in regulation of membrane protease activity
MIMVLVPMAPPGLALAAVAAAASAASAASVAVVPIVVVVVIVVIVIALGGRRRLSGRLRDDRRRWFRGRDRPLRR